MLAGGEAAAVAAAAMEQKIAGTLPARRKVLVNRLARLLGDLEPHRTASRVLPHGRTVDCITMWRNVLDHEAHHVTATRLAIDGEIEEREVPCPPCELQPSPNGPDLLRLERWLWSDQLAPCSRACVGAMTVLVLLMVSMILLPFLRRRPSMLRRRNRGPLMSGLGSRADTMALKGSPSDYAC
jgi:hypothetical protein